MASRSPLHRALAAWRYAELRLEHASPDDPDRELLLATVEALRAQYQALFDEIEDVAGHGAPFADEDEDEDRLSLP